MATYRSEVEGVLEVLGYMVTKLDPDGVDMFFTTSNISIKRCKDPQSLLRKLKAASFNGNSNMELRLGRLLHDYEMRLDNQKNSIRKISNVFRSLDLHRRRNIYVLTDGLWQPGCNVVAVIGSMVDKLEQQHIAHKHQIGIQFIRFGDNQDAKVLLRHLDDELDLGLCVSLNLSFSWMLTLYPLFTEILLIPQHRAITFGKCCSAALQPGSTPVMTTEIFIELRSMSGWALAVPPTSFHLIID